MNVPHKSKEKIVCIEYCNDKPFSVTTQNKGFNYYDFDWCESQEALYYHLSGSSPLGLVILGRVTDHSTPRKLWAAKGIKFARQRFNGKRLLERMLSKGQIREMGYEIIKKPIDLSGIGEKTCNPFDAAYEGEVVYCGICREYMPDDELCRHVFWDRFIGIYSGVGSEESKVGDFKEEILFFVSKLSKPVVEKLLGALKSNSICLKYHGSIIGSTHIELNGRGARHCDILEDFSKRDLKDGDEECKFVIGGEWLVSLEAEKTRDANKLIAGWIQEQVNE